MKREELPVSAKQLRSLLQMVRAHASLEGKRFRVRFADEEEELPVADRRQPLVEREDDPIAEPEVFNLVTEPWAGGVTFLGDVWCAEVRPGRPNIDDLRAERSEVQDMLSQSEDDIDPIRPPLVFEFDGTSDWASFVVTLASPETALDRIKDHPTIEVILDGMTGLAWLQRPLSEKELDLFEEKNWPVVLGQDYLEATEITEDSVLELREFSADQKANVQESSQS